MSRGKKTGMGCYGASPMEPWGLYKSHREFEEKLLKSWRAPFTGHFHDAPLAPYRLPQAGDVVAIENLSNRSEYNGVKAVVREGTIDADGRLLVDLIPSNAYQTFGSTTFGATATAGSATKAFGGSSSSFGGHSKPSSSCKRLDAAPSAMGSTLSAAVAHIVAATSSSSPPADISKHQASPPASSSSRRRAAQAQSETPPLFSSSPSASASAPSLTLSSSLGALDPLGLTSGPRVEASKKLRVAASKLRPLPQVLGSEPASMTKTMSMSATVPLLQQQQQPTPSPAARESAGASAGLHSERNPLPNSLARSKGEVRSGGGPLRFDEPHISGYLNAAHLKFPAWGCDPIKQKGPKKKRKG